MYYPHWFETDVQDVVSWLNRFQFLVLNTNSQLLILTIPKLIGNTTTPFLLRISKQESCYTVCSGRIHINWKCLLLMVSNFTNRATSHEQYMYTYAYTMNLFQVCTQRWSIVLKRRNYQLTSLSSLRSTLVSPVSRTTLLPKCWPNFCCQSL